MSKHIKNLILIVLLACGSAHAEFKDGNKLYDQMTNGNNSDWFNAIGYITGVADTGRGTLNCPPANVTAGQVFDMVKQQMESIPGARHLSADSIVNYVLSKNWPCQAKKGNAL